MSWSVITVDDFGWIIKLRLMENGAPKPLQTFTTKQFVFLKSDATELTVTASFVTDGSDGLLQYTVQPGDVNKPGTWRVRARIAKTGVELTSEPVQFTVRSRK